MSHVAPNPVRYELKRIATEAATGYFAAVAHHDPGFDEALAHCRACPNDVFMRRQVLGIIGTWDPATLRGRIEAARDDRFSLALFCEACLLHRRFKPLDDLFPAAAIRSLRDLTPLVFIKAHLREDAAAHRAWNRLFGANITGHVPLGPQHPRPLFTEQSLHCRVNPVVTLAQLFERAGTAGPTPRRQPAAQTFAMAMAALDRAGVVLGPEMRHQASLSPIALLRTWQLERRVDCGRNRFTLHGQQTAYGRGLDLDAARAAYAMEIVERCAAFADVDAGRASGYLQDHQLVHGPASQLAANQAAFLDPNTLVPEAPYRDEPLFWIAGTMAGAGNRPIWVPAQVVFLFANFDEVQLFSAAGSTGIAAGNTMAEAKVSALLEVIERDSASVMPFDPALCFAAETTDSRLAALLDSYRSAGIDVRFQDITTAMGVPCCKCFVTDSAKTIIAGTGAHLDARRALVAALTETPYPFPEGPASAPGPAGCLRVPLERLPDYSTGSATGDLAMLEALLLENGFKPIYVDLTRAEMGIPVVRAIVPGLDAYGDFERFARVHPRRYAHFRQHLLAPAAASADGRDSSTSRPRDNR